MAKVRTKLKPRDQERFRVTACVDRRGTCSGWNGRVELTILLKDIRDADTGKLLTDHMWFKRGVWSMSIHPGDKIAFDARVTTYVKGHRGRKDWRMERPTRVVKI